MNYTGKLNLLKFKNACLISVKGRTETKKGIFIPIDDNHVFVSADDANRAKGAYVSFLAFEGMEKGRYGDTHSMKQSYPLGSTPRDDRRGIEIRSLHWEYAPL